MKLSVCLPVYNVTPEFLSRALTSIDAQYQPAEEIVISDDRSSVNYDELVRPLIDSKKVRYFRNESNLGMVGNWNETIARSTGALVIVVGHDDELDRSMFQKMVRIFHENPDVALVSCGVTYIDGLGAPLPARAQVNHRDNIFVSREQFELSSRDVTYLCLRNGCALGELSALMFTRSAWAEVGGFDPRFTHGADVDFAMRVAQVGRTVYLRAPLLRRRMHKDNLTWKNLASGAIGRDRALRFEKHSNQHEFSRREKQLFRTYLVACAIWDALRFAQHKNIVVVWRALRQIGRYAHCRLGLYGKAVIEIVTGINIDRR